MKYCLGSKTTRHEKTRQQQEKKTYAQRNVTPPQPHSFLSIPSFLSLPIPRS